MRGVSIKRAASTPPGTRRSKERPHDYTLLLDTLRGLALRGAPRHDTRANGPLHGKPCLKPSLGERHGFEPS
eukprot:8561208-Lingulodinium_polyedra.AAC.1